MQTNYNVAGSKANCVVFYVPRSFQFMFPIIAHPPTSDFLHVLIIIRTIIRTNTVLIFRCHISNIHTKNKFMSPFWSYLPCGQLLVIAESQEKVNRFSWNRHQCARNSSTFTYCKAIIGEMLFNKLYSLFKT